MIVSKCQNECGRMLNPFYCYCFFLPCLQIIMVRLQRVTFLALHNYLGLTTELFSCVSLAGRPSALLAGHTESSASFQKVIKQMLHINFIMTVLKG